MTPKVGAKKHHRNEYKNNPKISSQNVPKNNTKMYPKLAEK